MAEIYTVEQVNRYIKNMFEQDFLLTGLSVRGEISNLKYHTSGHIYFSVKDKGGVLSCVMFAGRRAGLAFRLEEGQKVIVSGNIDVYERDGKYQLYAKKIEKEGIGDLYKRYLQLKEELEQMGMFAQEYKKPIPPYVSTVGIVTARTGAVIQDIVNVAGRRNPYVRLVLCPVKVQGEGAAASIAKGIAVLSEREDIDVIIVGRGGGSIEDLWAFNEEIVARAIFACEKPVISAVGHETDFTIADFVADLRAPTPSAAAELAVYEYAELVRRLTQSRHTMLNVMKNRLELARNRLADDEWRLERLSPSHMLNSKRQQVEEAHLRMERRMEEILTDRKHRLCLLSERLAGVSPLHKMGGGYAYVSDERLHSVSSVAQVQTGDRLNVSVKDGTIHAVVSQVEKKNSPLFSETVSD